MIDLPATLDYPIVAIGDLHGQRDELERLVETLGRQPEWPDMAFIFLGDFVDRGPDVRGAIDLVLELLRRPAGGSAVMGNHDLALVRAARIDGGPTSSYWVDRYKALYDHHQTFEGYLGRRAKTRDGAWEDDLDALRGAMPEEHREFLASLPWLVEASGHLFLHNGLSDELMATAEEQVEALQSRRWDRTVLEPVPGSATDIYWQPDYPVWLGADRRLSEAPLPHPGKVQVTGHNRVLRPDVNEARIRMDTSGGRGRLTACLFRSAEADPLFFPG